MMMTNQEMFNELQKSQRKVKRLKRKIKRLKRRNSKLDKALDIACGDVGCRDCSYCADSTNERCIKCLKELYMKRGMEDE